MPRIRCVFAGLLCVLWLGPASLHGSDSAPKTLSPVGLENMILRYKMYRYATLSDSDRQRLMQGLESYVQNHRFHQTMRVVRMVHQYETWDSTGMYEWQWQLDDSPSTLLRVMGHWSFHGEKMAMNVDDGNCLSAVIELPGFTIRGEYPFTTMTVRIVDFEITECSAFAPGEGEYRNPAKPDMVRYTNWLAEWLGVSIEKMYGTDDIDTLAGLFAEIPLDQPIF